MGDNSAINNLKDATAYNGYYWQGANISSKDLASNLVYTEDLGCIKSNWDCGITLNEDAIKDIVEKITQERELIKITPDEEPEIPKWTGFLPI
jgi:hypothetical protein